MMKILRKLRKDEKGATAIEYGLIAALIAVAAITALTSIGGELDATFAGVEGKLEKANEDGGVTTSTK